MRAASLPSFLRNLMSAPGARVALLVLVVVFALLAFGVTGVGAVSGPSFDVDKPFRWLPALMP